MAQPDFKERIEELHIEPTSVMTGDKNRSRFLLYQLKLSMAQAKKIDIIVSFLMESGVRMLIKDLKAALDRGAQIQILTGNYLGITQPSALFLIKKELGDKVKLRFYNDKERSFHPKSYIFHYEKMSEIYIGSSNISRSALTSGIEWNYRFSSKQDSQNFNLFYDTFLDLFENHAYAIDEEELMRYSKNWHKPALAKDLAKYEEENPFKRYMNFLHELHELSEEGEQLYSGIGREFLQLIETTDMQKVYKMPILYSFYNEGNIRLEVTDEEVLERWKEFLITELTGKIFRQLLVMKNISV